MSDAQDTDAQDRADLNEIRARLAGMDNAIGLAAQLNEGILEKSGLDLRTFHLVRAAALAASGAPSVTWRVVIELMDGEVTADELDGTLIAIAPIVGTARYMEAAQAIVAD